MASTTVTPTRKSGLRRRGHLLKGLRFLANDPKATPAQRLKACEMLFALEGRPDDSEPSWPCTPEMRKQIDAALAKCDQSPYA